MMVRNRIPIATDLTALDYPNIHCVQPHDLDWGQQDRDRMAWGLFALELIRRFELALLKPGIEKLVHGPVHSSIGQEATAVGAAMALEDRDKFTSTHRAHHHFLAKALAHYAPPTMDVSELQSSDSLRVCVRRTMAEIMGLSAGWVGGRGGSMHLFDRASGNIGTQAIVAGNIPYSSGIAFAEKFRGTGRVVVAYLGDGAVSIGLFHEGLCTAKAYGLPVVFVIENNLYGVATGVHQVTGLHDLILRSSGYNIPGLVVDGMDPLAVKLAVESARQHVAQESGPVMIEAKTYRYYHQSGGLPGSAFGYRTKEEERAWRDRDPITTWPAQLIQRGMIDQTQVDRLRDLAEQLVDDALSFCTRPDKGNGPRITPKLLPDPASASLHIRSDGREFADVNHRDRSDDDDTRDITMTQAISQVIARRMETDPEVFVIGEDVANLRGGAYGATRDALAQFPDRVLNAPIAEGGIVGIGHGAAVMGMKPIVEIMFCDFALVAADELFNQVATCRYMYNGQVDVPLIVRSRCSAGRGFGAQHSGDTVGLFAMHPGFRIVAPTTPFDYIGLFNTAMRSVDPVLVLEHHELARDTGPVPADDLDYLLPMGRSRIARHGADVTVITYLGLVPRVLRIAESLSEQECIEVEVIDLLTLDYANIDFETIGRSVAKTGAAVIVEQAIATQCLGPYVACHIHQQCGTHLRLPVKLASSHAGPMPVSQVLEAAMLISDEQIHQAILDTAKRTSRTSRERMP